MLSRCKSHWERVSQEWVQVLCYFWTLVIEHCLSRPYLGTTLELEAQRVQLTLALQLPDDHDNFDSGSWQDISNATRLDGILWGNEVIEISHEGREFELVRDLQERLSTKWRRQRMYVWFKISLKTSAKLIHMLVGDGISGLNEIVSSNMSMLSRTSWKQWQIHTWIGCWIETKINHCLWKKSVSHLKVSGWVIFLVSCWLWETGICH